MSKGLTSLPEDLSSQAIEILKNIRRKKGIADAKKKLRPETKEWT